MGSPGFPGCWLYRYYFLDDRTTLGVENPCAPRRPTYSRDISCCLRHPPDEAARLLTDAGIDWRAEVWRLCGADGFVDSAFDVDRFEDNLVPAPTEPLWWEWDDEALEYSPVYNAQPRAALMKRVLWLIASFQRGIPTDIDGLAARETVVDQMLDGSVQFRIYTPTEAGPEYPSSRAQERQCQGPVRQAFGGGPSPISRPNDPSDYADCEGTLCALSNRKYDLRKTVVFKWKYFNEAGEQFTVAPNALSGSNHAWPKSTDSVFVCSLSLDRAAVMYDWHWSMAAAHMWEMYDETDLRRAWQHLQAMQIHVRMALGVAAHLAHTMVHEMTHAVNLYHCANPLGEQAHCVQDIAAWAWWTHAVARLGLPNVFHTINNGPYGAVPLESEVRWTQDLGWGSERIRSGVVRFEGTVLRERVECSQGDVEEIKETTDVVEDWAGWIAAGYGVATVLTGGVVGVGIAATATVVWGTATLVEEGYDALTQPTDYADLSFAIDAPLVPGGNVIHCCVHNRPPGCSDVATTPCWPSDPPSTRYVDCCGELEPLDSTTVGVLGLEFPDMGVS